MYILYIYIYIHICSQPRGLGGEEERYLDILPLWPQEGVPQNGVSTEEANEEEEEESGAGGDGSGGSWGLYNCHYIYLYVYN